MHKTIIKIERIAHYIALQLLLVIEYIDPVPDDMIDNAIFYHGYRITDCDDYLIESNYYNN